MVGKEGEASRDEIGRNVKKEGVNKHAARSTDIKIELNLLLSFFLAGNHWRTKDFILFCKILKNLRPGRSPFPSFSSNTFKNFLIWECGRREEGGTDDTENFQSLRLVAPLDTRGTDAGTAFNDGRLLRNPAAFRRLLLLLLLLLLLAVAAVTLATSSFTPKLLPAKREEAQGKTLLGHHEPRGYLMWDLS